MFYLYCSKTTIQVSKTMTNRFINPDEVATKFGRSVSWLYKRYRELSHSQGFPQPIKTNGYNLQWSEAEVDVWFNQHISPRYRLNDNNPGSAYEKLLAANAVAL